MQGADITINSNVSKSVDVNNAKSQEESVKYVVVKVAKTIDDEAMGSHSINAHSEKSRTHFVMTSVEHSQHSY